MSQFKTHTLYNYKSIMQGIMCIAMEVLFLVFDFPAILDIC